MKRVKILAFILLFMVVFSSLSFANEINNNESNTIKIETTSEKEKKEESNNTQVKETTSETKKEEKSEEKTSTNKTNNTNNTNSTIATSSKTTTTSSKTNTTTSVSSTKNTKISQTNNTLEEKVVEVKLELNSLKIYGINSNNKKEEIKISPDFNKEIFEYKAEVENEIKSVEIEKDSGKIESTIEGNTTLNDGENKFEIILKDKSKSVKYSLVINRKEEVKEEKNTILTTRKEQQERSKVGLVVAIVILVSLVVVLIMRVIKNRR